MPRTRTAFTLAGARRDFWATSRLRITVEKDLVLVMRSNLSGSSESRLILMRRRPAARRRSQRSASRWPLVGMETRDVVFDTFADERLAASDADFANAQTEEDLGKPVEFGPGENFVVIAV